MEESKYETMNEEELSQDNSSPVQEETCTELEEVESFENFGLKENLLRGIYAFGFELPSSIQKKAILPMIAGNDMVAQAQSGTGKTGTFGISTLQIVDESLKGCQAMLISPTRELAEQINNVITSIGQYMDVTTVLCVGGMSMDDNISKLRNGAQIVIGTTGRIMDLIKRKYLLTNKIKLFVMDEADQLLDMHFKEQVRTIVQNIPEKTQICLFSATMPYDKLEVANMFLNNPINVLVKSDQLTLEGISQFYIDVDREEWKLDTLCDLYNMIAISQAMIYVNTKRKADWLSENLINRNFTVSVMHSDMSSEERRSVMKEFRDGKTRILLSTDLLSRGIDIQQVSIVVNYDLPNNKESYIHRIGRSGRFGRKGVAINLVTQRDSRCLRDLESFYHTQIMEMPENINTYI
jgi:translation initiation factor 4A